MCHINSISEYAYLILYSGCVCICIMCHINSISEYAYLILYSGCVWCTTIAQFGHLLL